jgi:hypothetical protein
MEPDLKNTFSEVTRFLFPILAGTPAGFVISESFQWRNPLAVALLGSVGAALILGLLDRALQWRRDNRQSAEKIAEIMSTMHKDMLDRQDSMRLEQRAYYRELIGDFFSDKEAGRMFLKVAEVKKQMGSNE